MYSIKLNIDDSILYSSPSSSMGMHTETKINISINFHAGALKLVNSP